MITEAVALIKTIVDVLAKGLETREKYNDKSVRESCEEVFKALGDLDQASVEFISAVEGAFDRKELYPFVAFDAYTAQKKIDAALKKLSRSRNSAFQTLEIYEPEVFHFVRGIEMMKTCARDQIDQLRFCGPMVETTWHQDQLLISEPLTLPKPSDLGEKVYPIFDQEEFLGELEKDIYRLRADSPKITYTIRAGANDRTLLEKGRQNIEQIRSARELLRKAILRHFPSIQE